MAEKAAPIKTKNKFLKFLQKAAAAPPSPNRSSHKSHIVKGANAPIHTIVPADALRSKSRNWSFGAREPTSPQVSCMGQLKHKKKLCSMINNKSYVLPPLDHLNLMVHTPSKAAQSDLEGDKKKKKPLAIKNMFSRVPSRRRKSDATTGMSDNYVKDSRPSSSSSCSLSQMRRFSSSRTSLNNFDWTATATATQIAPVDNEGGKAKISTGVPKVILECKEVSFEPRKDVSLWKRRPMAQPTPLQL